MKRIFTIVVLIASLVFTSCIAVLCPTGRRNRLAPVYSHGAVLAADGFLLVLCRTIQQILQYRL